MDYNKNLQPLERSMNCSKGCTLEGTEHDWKTYKGQPINPEYKKWLEKQQNARRDEIPKMIDELNKGRW